MPWASGPRGVLPAVLAAACLSLVIAAPAVGAAPIAPTIDSTDPRSPANDNAPEVRGIAEFDSTVRIYDDAACTDPPLATGAAASFNSDGITTPVPDDQTTSLHATATNQLGETSACGAPFTYIEDSTAPPVPVITDTDPDSPADDNNPEFKGTAEAGSEVILYPDAACASTSPASVGSAEEFASPGLQVSVSDNTTTVLRATARDQAGNISACSDPFSYTETTAVPDKTAPVVLLGGKAKQRFDGAIEVEVQCDEACGVSATGAVTVKGGTAKRAGKTKLKLRPLTSSFSAGQKGVLAMKLSRKNAKTLKSRLKHGAKAKAVVALTVADGAGNQRSLQRSVKLKK